MLSPKPEGRLPNGFSHHIFALYSIKDQDLSHHMPTLLNDVNFFDIYEEQQEQALNDQQVRMGHINLGHSPCYTYRMHTGAPHQSIMTYIA